MARLAAFAAEQQIRVTKVVAEVGSGCNGHRKGLLAVLRAPEYGMIVVEHRDRLTGCTEAGISKQDTDRFGGWEQNAMRRGTALMESLAQCSTILGDAPGVRALIVAGSGARGGTLDAWSDLDLVVVVEDAALTRYAPDLGWLAPLGRVYAVNTSGGAERCTVRVCFSDLRRIDFVFVAESSFEAFAGAEGPLQGGAHVVFDRTGAVPAALRRVPAGPPSAPTDADAAFRRMDEELRWNGVLAAVKVGRGDRLIGGHLALEMAQSCLVLAMLLRDRATATRHHRHGSGPAVAALDLPLPGVLSTDGILDLIEAAANAWAEMGAQWDGAYEFDRGPLLALLQQARGGGPR